MSPLQQSNVSLRAALRRHQVSLANARDLRIPELDVCLAVANVARAIVGEIGGRPASFTSNRVSQALDLLDDAALSAKIPWYSRKIDGQREDVRRLLGLR